MIARVVTELGVTGRDACVMWSDLIDWLVAAGTDTVPHAPPAALDEVWHVFLLFTRRYARFCRDKIGRFVHHDPEIGPADLGENFDRAVRERAWTRAKFGRAWEERVWDDHPRRLREARVARGP